MKVVIPLVILNNLFEVSAATHDPDPGHIFDHMLSRARNARDCPMYILREGDGL
jgi:hypothetical protein